MRRFILALCLLLGGCSSVDESTDATLKAPSPGCGKATDLPAMGVQINLDVGPEGDGQRAFYLSLPPDYDPNRAHKLVVAYAGTNWVGQAIQPYFAFEGFAEPNEIFVFPDVVWREFEGWGTMGGWLLGPHAHPAHGMQDIAFTEAILDYMSENFCVDPDRVFAAGHSWGGDMAMVVACFLGDRFRAVAPSAANRPYWFEKGGGEWTSCVGNTAVWFFFGQDDDHFTNQDHPGAIGEECRDFWLQEKQCDGVEFTQDLFIGKSPSECVSFKGCSSPLRYCFYDGEFGHQNPIYYTQSVLEFFRSF